MGQQPQQELPPGWSAIPDPASGKTYYAHHPSGETRWDRPQQLPPGSSANPNANGAPSPGNQPRRARAGSVESALSRPSLLQQQSSNLSQSQPQQQLPLGWTAIQDPATGRFYYNNATTGKTTWEKPIAGTANPNGTGHDQRNLSPYANASAPQPNSRQNSVQQGLVGLAQGSVVSSPIPVNLQSGWTSMKDATGGKTFYQNITTGETRWEMPTGLGVSDSNLNVNGNTNMNHQVQKAQSQMQSQPQLQAQPQMQSQRQIQDLSGSQPQLPPGWEPFKDPASGKNFYRNTITNETTWDLPPAKVITTSPTNLSNASSVTGFTAATGPDPGLGQTIPTSPSNVSALSVGNANQTQPQQQPQPHVQQQQQQQQQQQMPPGWKESKSLVNGKTYFTNMSTGKATWERPQNGSPNIHELTTTSTIASPVSSPLSASPSTPTINSGSGRFGNTPWEGLSDPATGKTFYRNRSTGETKWENPTTVSGSMVNSPTSVVSGPVSSPSTPTASNHQAQGGLPKGWTAVVDLGTGKTFYKNEYTGRTSWDVPGADGTGAALSPGFPQAKSNDSAQSQQLPPGWEGIVDLGSGKTFYRNASTGQSTWEKPVAPAALSPPDHMSSSSPIVVVEEPLPSGWVAVKEHSTGKTYYANSATGETSWQRPNNIGGAADAPSAMTESYHDHPGVPPRRGKATANSPTITEDEGSEDFEYNGSEWVRKEGHPAPPPVVRSSHSCFWLLFDMRYVYVGVIVLCHLHSCHFQHLPARTLLTIFILYTCSLGKL